MADATRYRLGVDVGGTYTDLVLLDASDGTISIEKVASTPDDPARAVLNGIARCVAAGTAPETIEFFSHGTTITTNALLQMRGAKVGLLITAGYRAVQEVQNQARDGNPFDYFYKKPEAIAPQSLTREIPGRIDYEGNELTPLDEKVVRQAARELRGANVDSIAVCFLFSFMNPGHERAARAILLDEIPDAHVSLSSEVLPRIREWPRLSTTLLNAYLEPVLVGYISNLAAGLDAAGVYTPQRFLMQSNGGVMPFVAAVTGGKTVQTLLSGPAAGARASAHLAVDDARDGLVTLDMGGTSCDIAFIEGGQPLEVTESVFLREGSRAGETLDQILALGVGLSLDDFGTGYSALGYLSKTRFSTIKVDRSFVQGAARGAQESIAIIRAVVAMAESLGMSTTAEGAETEHEVQVIRELGCKKIQGYFYGRPMTADDVQSLFGGQQTAMFG